MDPFDYLVPYRYTAGQEYPSIPWAYSTFLQNRRFMYLQNYITKSGKLELNSGQIRNNDQTNQSTPEQSIPRNGIIVDPEGASQQNFSNNDNAAEAVASS